MKLGSKIVLKIFLVLLFMKGIVYCEERIRSVPLINLDTIKPSFEETDAKNETLDNDKTIKAKKNKVRFNKKKVILTGLDKITAKTTDIELKLNEIKKFGSLEIKVLKCGKIKNNNKFDEVAYMQVKDFTKNENEKVFIFNGWTFASDPNLTPFDHAIYDLQLKSCSV
tara:strand:- start:2175 stop:2678 length:504 start_codon:yes stop_codon:yes gene_type:complete